ncbi:right-handed parallel beta-helix repeat-containing protein [bacterium]|nr:right-handed parallel beta-helix repeat-containing protein [bacterium]
MSNRIRPRLLFLLAIVHLLPTAALAVTQLEPEACVGNSVLPATYQMWQTEPRWMGVAVAPQNPINAVYLEILSGTNPAALVSYDPPVLSDLGQATNFAVKNFAGQPDGWVFMEASPPTPGNLAHVADWSEGLGVLAPGPYGSTLTYGGLNYGCGLFRVFTVFLEAGKTYRFNLTRDNVLDDVKMALLRTGSLPDGWVTRADALWEKGADPTGAAQPQSFAAAVTANYALAVFVDDLTAAGGQYTVRFEEYTAPADQPDLVVTAIDPVTAFAGIPVTATVHVTNQGGAASDACVAQVILDYVEICGSAAVPAIPAGGSAVAWCSLPAMTAGNHDLYAFADYGDAVAEGDETNNARMQTLTVSSSPSLPDLTILEAGPTAMVANQATEVWIKVGNVGGAAADTTTTRYDVDFGATRLHLPTPALNPGQSVIVKGILPGLGDGQHHVETLANSAGSLAEVTLTNNGLGFTVNVTGPNLVVDGFTPTSFLDTDPITFEVTVRNAGNAACVATHTQVKFLPQGPMTSVATPALAAGASSVVSVTVPYPPAPGAYTVEACADASSLQAESSETDNCLQGPVTILPTVIVWPDAVAQYPTLQAAIDAVAEGGTVRVRAGTYTGSGNRDLDFHGKDLTLEAYGDGEVVLDCQGDPENPRRGFRFTSGETNAAVVDGLTIANGRRETGSGGAILIGDAEPTIRNCVIRDCYAHEGGAIVFSSLHDYFHPSVQGCTLAGNGANFGDAVYAAGNIGPFLENTLIAGNYGYYGAVVCDGMLGTPRLTLSCCDIWGNGGGDWTGSIASQLGTAGNFSQDPLFCNAGTDDYHLASNSPCAEAMNASCGLIGALPATCGPMGGTVRHVKADATGEYLTIQHALNNCVDGDVVELADGVYTGTGNRDVNPLGLAVLIRSASGDPYACRIDAQHAYRGFYLRNGEGHDTVISGIGVFNGAAATGAGIACDGASPTLDNLYVADCNATDDGGGIHLVNYASPIITDCLLENNTAADDGGGLYAATWSSPTITGTTFLGNLTNDVGAGAYFAVNCFPEIDACTFRGNEGTNGGGLGFVYAYGPVRNTLFFQNSATNGGAYYGYGNARCAFTSCTFSDNTAANGAQVYLRNNSDPTFDRCILAFGINGAAFVRNDAESTATLTCCDVHGNAGGDWTAMISDQFGVNGNLNQDPLFCNHLNEDLTLRGDSPCAVVNNAGCGQIGAFAVGCSGSWLVRPDGTGDFATIQQAIDAAAPGETVVLADGTYTGPGNRDLSFAGKAITLRSQSGDADLCVIDCQGSASSQHYGIYFTSAETAASVLENVTIRGGYKGTGAGCRIDAASPTLRGVVFRDNIASDSGAGVIMYGGAAPTIEDCRFLDNAAANAGGGMYVNTAYPQLVRCEFRGNSAFWGGGGLYNQYASPNVIDCTFIDNTSDHWGGGVHNRYAASAPNFTRCLFTGNSAPQGGASYSRDASTPAYFQCTFYGNSSADGAVLHGRSSSVLSVIRCILSFSFQGAAVTGDGTATFNLLCCDVFGNVGGDYTGPIAGQAGTNDNIHADPVFCDVYDDDFTLGGISPCLPGKSECGQLIGALGEGCVVSAVGEPDAGIPGRLALLPNVPNPFNPATVIRYDLPGDGRVRIEVFDMAGRLVDVILDEVQSAGDREVTWRGRDDRGRSAASGLYFVRLRFGGETQVRKIMLAR